ncbi:S4 domain-containing protein, partial [Porticoccaceae bacterium]|nr:S4 domain-containing protein [Porticoccaceae bacterium]
MEKVRIDKWLWAARFYKTRSLAKAAIEGGKVHIDGQKSKPSRMLELGLMLHIRQGDTSKTVEVMRLSEHRRG